MEETFANVFQWFISGWGVGFLTSMIFHFVWLATGAGKWFTYLGGDLK